MKKIIMGLIAASVIAAPAAAAPFHGFDRGHQQTKIVKVKKTNRGRQVVKVKRVRQVQNRKWARGQRFDSRYARNYRVIYNPRAYRLHDAPRGYRWVQSGNDAVLVAITSGIIGAVIGGALN